MKRYPLACISILLALAFHGAPAEAQAQATRTYVASFGNDGHNCTAIPTPCRTFAGALPKTLARGEIWVLDSASYGTVVIDKAVSIINEVGTAGIAVPSGDDGIRIVAGANDRIYLRGLTISSRGAAGVGILFQSGLSLNVQDCVIRGFSGSQATGISFRPGGAVPARHLSVSDTVVADTSFGIWINPQQGQTGAVTAVLSGVEVDNGVHGIIVDGRLSTGALNATIADSVVNQFALRAVSAVTTTGKSPTTVTVSNSTMTNGANGLIAEGDGAVIRVGGSTITGNNVGVAIISSGDLFSYGDNYIDGNTTDGGPPFVIPVK